MNHQSHRYLITIFSTIICWQTIGCVEETDRTTQPIKETAAPAGPSVWAVDLVRTLPGQQEEYLLSIKNNWAQARHIIQENGLIASYRALSVTPDSTRDWDVLLMTEYSDSVSWAARESIFREVFGSSEYSRVPSEIPSNELRAFFEAGIVMREVTSSASSIPQTQ